MEEAQAKSRMQNKQTMRKSVKNRALQETEDQSSLENGVALSKADNERKLLSEISSHMSMLGICELVAVGILLLCNCLNLMNVFGVFDGH